ncbi:MAG: hypothetical protein IKR85_00110 [Clostridia bacterium]|nr:hypothetical protein [Clostridia bacterium]
MREHFAYYIHALEEHAKNALKCQCRDKMSPYYGCFGSSGGSYGVYSGSDGAAQLISAYSTPGCALENSTECLEGALAALRFALKYVHSDGTTDLLVTNFHDASENAFIVSLFAPAYLRLRLHGIHTNAERELDSLCFDFTDRLAQGMLAGGFHTPNHRWIQSAALAFCYKLTGRRECLARIEQFLSEGIDCDENGEYTERSTGVYNHVCNRAFIDLAFLLDRPEFLEYVRRNLKHSLTFFEPDDTVNTMNSTRQDFGQKPDTAVYYSELLYMAMRDRDAEFAWEANRMLERFIAKDKLSYALPCALYGYYTYNLLNAETADAPCITERETAKSYEKLYAPSGIMRKRNGDFSLTLVKEHADFAKLMYKNHTVYLRLAASFFAKGQFAAQTLEKTEDGYIMSFEQLWGYKQPLETPPATSDWRRMDHSLRKDVMMQLLRYEVSVRPLETGVDLVIKAYGTDFVPLKLEILTQPGTFVSESVLMHTRAGDYIFLKGDTAKWIYAGRDALLVKGGFHSHYTGESMRGTLGADGGCCTIALTGETPLEKRVTLEFREAVFV